MSKQQQLNPMDQLNQDMKKKGYEFSSESGPKKIYIDPSSGRRKVVTLNTLPSKTDGSFKKQCDAKEIVHKFATTGQVSHLAKKPGQYQDVSHVQDLHASLIQVQRAKTEFMSQPAKIRAMFDNDMEKFYAFLTDPSQNEKAVELGLKTWTPEAEQVLKTKETKNGTSKKTDSSDNNGSKSSKSSGKDN